MQVFRLCLKILKKQIPSMLIYIIIFLAIALIMSSATANEQQQDNSFTRAKSNMALISEENTPLIDGFKQELGKVANFVELPDDHEALQDALYFRSVSYILRVPEGRGKMCSWKRQLCRIRSATLISIYALISTLIQPGSMFNKWRIYRRNRWFNTSSQI